MSRWLQVKQLRLWIWLLLVCEQRGWTASETYYWFAARAMRCNRWRQL